MTATTITEHTVTTGVHTTGYLAAGPEDGPLIIFVHGWPELSLSWRHQMPAFASLGFRVIAPDMRGYGRSTAPRAHDAYTLKHIVSDMIGLLNELGQEKAVWVGHDWGAPVVWSIANHHPDRCHGVANLCVPYRTLEHSWDALVERVNRDVYPIGQFPVGQWDYQLFYQENFPKATAVMDADPYNMVKALFRKGDPDGVGKPSATASIRAQGGWFGGAAEPPDVPRDADVVSEDDIYAYAEALSKNGFFGPNSYYMNHEANAAYSQAAVNDGTITMPVLFLHARYDYTCETTDSTLAEPMRALCENLTEKTILSGHWMAQERPVEVNGALAQWIVQWIPGIWPQPETEIGV